MSITGQVLRLHEQLYKRTDGRIGHRMLGVPIGRDRRKATARIVERSEPDFDRLWKIVNDGNRDRCDAYQKQTARQIPIIALRLT